MDQNELHFTSIMKSESYSEVEYCGFKNSYGLKETYKHHSEKGAHSNQNIPSIVKVKSKSKRRTKLLQLNRYFDGSLTGPQDQCSQSFLVAVLHVTCNQELPTSPAPGYPHLPVRCCWPHRTLFLAPTQGIYLVHLVRHHWVTTAAASHHLRSRETHHLPAARVTLWIWMHAPAPTQEIFTCPLSITMSSLWTSPSLLHASFSGSDVTETEISVVTGPSQVGKVPPFTHLDRRKICVTENYVID